MGYYSTLEGGFTFSKIRQPIEVTHKSDPRHPNNGHWDLTLVPATRTVKAVVEGQEEEVEIHFWTGISVPEDSGKYYGLVDDLQEVVGHVLGLDPSAKIVGHIERDGEEQGDQERYYVGADGRIVSVKAQISWPEPDMTGDQDG